MSNNSICITCDNEPGCVYLSKPGRSIFSCEEFYLDHKTEDKYEEVVKIEKERIEKENSIYSGLCVNCELRKDCKIRNENFVIWHCEEYL